jgi:hypothetical protein
MFSYSLFIYNQLYTIYALLHNGLYSYHSVMFLVWAAIMCIDQQNKIGSQNLLKEAQKLVCGCNNKCVGLQATTNPIAIAIFCVWPPGGQSTNQIRLKFGLRGHSDRGICTKFQVNGYKTCLTNGHRTLCDR